MEALDVLAAVTHPDPYPYYRALLAGPPLAFDARLKLWVAANAAAVDAVLSNPACTVRPAHEPVPAALVGSTAGAVFGNWARMNDGVKHEAPKRALQRSLASVDLERLAMRGAAIAERFAAGAPSPVSGARLSRWVFEVPIAAVADLLGFAEAELPQVAAWTVEFIAGLAPAGSAQQRDDANRAAQALLQRFAALVHAAAAQPASVLSSLQREAAQAGWNDAQALLANLVGLLSQTAEATAGLIGNSIVTLSTRPALLDALRARPALAGSLVREVARFDAPVQNTRRYVAAPVRIAGADLQAGDTVLLVLAAANRDPALDADPDALQPERAQCRMFTFGRGPHACPGEALACTIAASALNAFLAQTPRVSMPRSWRYRPSANTRIPQFDEEPHPA